jgi:hypothetical protein
MIEQARRAELRFDEKAVDDIKRASNAFGPMHDSRRGVASYYRYQPRRIGARLEHPDRESGIMQDPSVLDEQRRRRGLLTSVRVHESVVDRMRSGTDGYAPIVLPERYEIARDDGSIVPPREDQVTGAKRWTHQERVWDEVWWRRIVYFTTVGASLILLALPALHWIWPPSACEAWLCPHAAQIARAGAFIPDFVPGPPEPKSWTDAFARQPGLFLFLAVVAIAGFLRGTTIQRRIHDRMREVWTGALELPGSKPLPAMRPDDDTPIHRLRSNPAYQMVFRGLKWWLVPSAFGLGILWVATTLAIWALLGLARVALEHQVPELTPSDLMAVGALATLALVVIAERRSIWRWLVETLGRRGDPPASLPSDDSGRMVVGESWSPAPAGSTRTPAMAGED